jgi:hypothetical protein
MGREAVRLYSGAAFLFYTLYFKRSSRILNGFFFLMFLPPCFGYLSTTANLLVPALVRRE